MAKTKTPSIEALCLAAKIFRPTKGIFINGNADPRIPVLDKNYSDYTPYDEICSHERQGVFDFRFEDVELVEVTRDIRTESEVKTIVDKIKTKRLIPLNINFLTKLMEKHREEIPQLWQQFNIIFLGTIYGKCRDKCEPVGIPTMYCCKGRSESWWLWQVFSYSNPFEKARIICLPESSRLI